MGNRINAGFPAPLLLFVARKPTRSRRARSGAPREQVRDAVRPPPVTRPVGGILDIWRLREALFVAGSAGLLAKQIHGAAGGKQNRPAVWRPDRESVGARMK